MLYDNLISLESTVSTLNGSLCVAVPPPRPEQKPRWPLCSIPACCPAKRRRVFCYSMIGIIDPARFEEFDLTQPRAAADLLISEYCPLAISGEFHDWQASAPRNSKEVV
jgi:hypothetical protein